MRKFLLAPLSLVAAVGFWAYAQGQVNVVPQVGQINSIIKNSTFSGTAIGLVPAASATDIFCLKGSTSKMVHLDRLIISGTAGTAVTTPVLLNLNHSLDTGGTAASGLALPVPVPLNGTDVASATMTAYTANPTVTDATPNLLLGPAIGFPVTTTATQRATELVAGSSVDMFNKGWDIQKAGTVVQELCLNLNGVSVSSGVLSITAEWTEQ